MANKKYPGTDPTVQMTETVLQYQSAVEDNSVTRFRHSGSRHPDEKLASTIWFYKRNVPGLRVGNCARMRDLEMR